MPPRPPSASSCTLLPFHPQQNGPQHCVVCIVTVCYHSERKQSGKDSDLAPSHLGKLKLALLCSTCVHEVPKQATYAGSGLLLTGHPRGSLGPIMCALQGVTTAEDVTEVEALAGGELLQQWLLHPQGKGRTKQMKNGIALLIKALQQVQLLLSHAHHCGYPGHC